jgi:DNA-binding HxlR family transcriptional regulator
LQVNLLYNITCKKQVVLKKKISMPKTEPRSDCPISSSLDIWGDKWSLLIVRDLMLSQKHTYGEFLNSDEKISTNILATRLLALEEAGIIEKLDHPDSKAKVWYQLTHKGIELMPVVVEISLWAEKYADVPHEIKQMLAEVKKDKTIFLQEKIAELRALQRIH